MIKIDIQPDLLTPSSSLSECKIFSDSETVFLTIELNGEEIHYGKYYPSNGSVTVSDLSDLIHLYFQNIPDNPIAVCNILATGDGELDSVEFRVIYCDRLVEAQNLLPWLEENFITLSPIRRIAPDENFTVHFFKFKDEGNSVKVTAFYLDLDGERQSYQYDMSVGPSSPIDGIYALNLSVERVATNIMSANGLDYLPQISSISIQFGKRLMSLFVDAALTPAKWFSFRNCFNVVEKFPILCETKEKALSESSVANLGNSSMLYDIHNSKEYESESAPLYPYEVEMAELMLYSYDVRLDSAKSSFQQFEFLPKILITDFTSELSDSDEALNTIKFSWQFADNSPRLELPLSPGIFNDSFIPVYS